MKIPAEWRHDGWTILEERLELDHANLSHVVSVALDFVDTSNSGGGGGDDATTAGGYHATPHVEQAIGLRVKVQAEENEEFHLLSLCRR